MTPPSMDPTIDRSLGKNYQSMAYETKLNRTIQPQQTCEDTDCHKIEPKVYMQHIYLQIAKMQTYSYDYNMKRNDGKHKLKTGTKKGG